MDTPNENNRILTYQNYPKTTASVMWGDGKIPAPWLQEKMKYNIIHFLSRKKMGETSKSGSVLYTDYF